jgi:hypothetical protein
MQGEACIAWLMGRECVCHIRCQPDSAVHNPCYDGIGGCLGGSQQVGFFGNMILKGILVAAILAPLFVYAIRSAGFRSIVFEVKLEFTRHLKLPYP